MYTKLFFLKSLKKDYRCVYHAHPYWEICFSSGSGGYIKTHAGKAEFNDGDIIIHSPGLNHLCYNEKESIQYILGVSGDGLKGLRDTVIPADEKMAGIFLQLLSELKMPDKFHEKIISLMAEELVIRIKREIDEGTECPEAQKPIEAVKTIIDNGYKQEVDLDFLSGRVFLSKDYIRHSFKKEYGTSPIQYLIKKRIDNAKEMLMNTDKLVREIAVLSGFSDEYYFSKLFKKVTDFSPLKFRNASKKSNLKALD